MISKPKISIIGAGNVGHNFGLAFRQAGYLIAEIYSRTQNSAMLLSQTLNCNFTTNLKQLTDKTDLFVIAVNDDVIEEVDQVILGGAFNVGLGGDWAHRGLGCGRRAGARPRGTRTRTSTFGD